MVQVRAPEPAEQKPWRMMDRKPDRFGITRLLPGAGGSFGVRRFLQRGALAVADQSCSALASLAINLMLIWWLLPDEYGAFAVAFAWVLLLSGVQNALLLEPMLVLGAGRYKDDLLPYLRALALGHWPVSAALSGLLLLIGAATWVLGTSVLGTAFAGAAFAAPGLIFLQFARRACYLHGDLRPAVAGGALYLLLTLIGLWALSVSDWLAPFQAFLLIGLAGFGIGAGILRRHGVRVAGAGQHPALRPVALEHWKYGRWVIASTLASWVPGNLYFLVLPVTTGLEAAGVLAALMLFLRPTMTVVQPLALMMTPRLTRMNQKGDHTLRHVLAMTFLFMVGSMLYWSLLALGHGPLVEAILGAQYRPYSFILLIVGGVAPTMAAASVLASGLRAAMRPDLEFRAHLFSAVVAVVIGLPLVILLDLTGAALGLATSYLALAAAMMVLLLKNGPASALEAEKRP